MIKYLFTALLLISSVSMAQTTIYFSDGSYRDLEEGEVVYVTDSEFVFTVPKGGYQEGEFVFTRLFPLLKAEEEEEEKNCLTFGGDSCIEHDEVDTEAAIKLWMDRMED